MQAYFTDLLSQLGTVSYLLIFVVSALECAAFLGLLIPGESILLVCGFLAHAHRLNLDAVVVAGVVGAIVGDNVGYWMGHRIGDEGLLRAGSRLGLTRDRADSTRAMFNRHGSKAVFFGRFVGYARALVPFMAGAAGMPRRTFFVYNAVGALLWGTGVVLLGYALGASWRVAEVWLGRWSLLALLIAVIVALVMAKRHRSQRR